MKTADSRTHFPVAVIGGGPIGLHAALHLLANGERPLILEASSRTGANIRRWGHVRLFTPWKLLTDSLSREVLRDMGWAAPPDEVLPTGSEFVRMFLDPLAAHPMLARHLVLERKVVAVSRRGLDKAVSAGREDAPFEIVTRKPSGSEVRYLAKAVIDASGTYTHPNPLGSNGLPVDGEMELRRNLYYGIPDVFGPQKTRYARKRTLVVGGGHSALNAIADVAELSLHESGTEVLWAVRRDSEGAVFGPADADILPARQGVIERARGLVSSARVELVTGFRASKLRAENGGIVVEGGEGKEIGPVDQVIVATGYRPDVEMLREVRLDLDPSLDAPAALASLIDPRVHTCGTVPLHGYEQLEQPETDFFIVGMKSYGRAPTFLLHNGYEQVRSVAAALSGNRAAARVAPTALPANACSPAGAGASCCSPITMTASRPRVADQGR